MGPGQQGRALCPFLPSLHMQPRGWLRGHSGVAPACYPSTTEGRRGAGSAPGAICPCGSHRDPTLPEVLSGTQILRSRWTVSTVHRTLPGCQMAHAGCRILLWPEGIATVIQVSHSLLGSLCACDPCPEHPWPRNVLRNSDGLTAGPETHPGVFGPSSLRQDPTRVLGVNQALAHTRFLLFSWPVLHRLTPAI